MKLGIIIFLIFILLLLTSKIKINVVSFEKKKGSFALKFQVKLGFYLFGWIKILGISGKEEGIHFLGFQIPYRNMKIDKKMIQEVSILSILKSLSFQVDELEMKLKIGTEDMILTVFSVFAISTFFSVLLGKYSHPKKQRKCHYQVMPVYGKNELSFVFSSKISISLFHFLQTFWRIKKMAKSKKKIHLKNIPLKI